MAINEGDSGGRFPAGRVVNPPDPPTPRSSTVLVVDDDPMNLVILTSLLEAGGYRTRTAVDGAEALSALDEEDFEAILLDVVMPVLDGVDVLQSVKSHARHWRVPVIMVSAVDDSESIVRCLQLGADDYVTKPFDPVVLQARLDACLARRRFGDLEGEYQRLVDEQARELERMQGDLAGLEPTHETVAGSRQGRLGVVVVALSGLNVGAAALEPAEALAAAGDFVEVVRKAAARHGATVDRAGPEEVTVVVGATGPVPDPAATALDLAQDVVEEMETLTAAWGRVHGGRWVVGAGVAAGEAVVGMIGTQPSFLGVIGAVVDDARRRCATALEHGGIVVEDGSPSQP